MLNNKNILNELEKSGRLKNNHVFYSAENDNLLSIDDLKSILKDYKKDKKYIKFDYRIGRDNNNNNNLLMIKGINILDNNSKFKTKFLDEYICLWDGINSLGGWQVFSNQLKDLYNL